ncbi:MAG TPA: 50S ribosomal protein L25 [Herpetosiphonaceae bacterium]|nr:50S ribosomal protein L25 [Herpetosiphonaceae bacterium]
MDKLTLTLEPRSVTGKKVKHLRANGQVPASICGRGVTPENFVTDARTFGKVYQIAGRSALIELQTPSGPRQAFIRQIQRHPISNVWLHVDFRVVDMRVSMTADVPVVLVGENELVTRGEGITNQIMTMLHVRALPGDLPQNIEVDIGRLVDFSTVLHVSDLEIPENVEVLTAPEEPVVSLTQSRTAVEDEAITEQEQLGEPELAGDDADDNDAAEE